MYTASISTRQDHLTYILDQEAKQVLQLDQDIRNLTETLKVVGNKRGIELDKGRLFPDPVQAKFYSIDSLNDGVKTTTNIWDLQRVYRPKFVSRLKVER